jgi:hypothetical protein
MFDLAVRLIPYIFSTTEYTSLEHMHPNIYLDKVEDLN